MATYYVIFDHGKRRVARALPFNFTVGDLKDGIWVDEDLELSLNDNKYWIPPSKIQYVEKVENDG